MSITVGGFKSIAREQTVDIRPLTILAGANSSGKSSLMQAVLLLKQTLEASYDPGPLLINGPNVRFTQFEQILSRCNEAASEVRIGFHGPGFTSATLTFQKNKKSGLEVTESTYGGKEPRKLEPNTSESNLKQWYSRTIDAAGSSMFGPFPATAVTAKVVRERCFLLPVFTVKLDGELNYILPRPERSGERTGKLLRDIIHVPGLRGNPERAYHLAATGPAFPGTFEAYTASIISDWSNNSNRNLDQAGEDLKLLGLTWKVTSKALDDARVELQVGRLKKPRQGGAKDMVNISDVGFGVSQTLPVVVALLVGKPDQLLYIEQPEIHLHPRAQVAMGRLLANAAKRGVRVIVETHSSLLLLGVQSQIAEGDLDPNLVKLHWFKRNEDDGSTEIISSDIDEQGRFPEWPEDFDDVSLEAQQHYMDAVEKRMVAG